MENIQQEILTHPYQDKKGNLIKKPRINPNEVLEAYSYLINKTKGRLTTRLLRLTFTDKSKDFTKILTDNNYIKLVKEKNTIKVTLSDGGVKYVSTPNVYNCL